jgi:hypothetical protein
VPFEISFEKICLLDSVLLLLLFIGTTTMLPTQSSVFETAKKGTVSHLDEAPHINSFGD